MSSLEQRRIRTRLEAALLDAGAEAGHDNYGERKQAAIGAMTGTVVELGPGTGVNMRYYAPGTKVIGIEPNPGMHDRLRARADEHGVDIEIRTLRGEGIDVADGEADGVVATLVLCGVDDPSQVVAEVQRVLKPGGTFFFLEHVVAPDGTGTRTAQRVLKRPHRWLFNGCLVDRDTATLLAGSGFASIEIDHHDEGPAGLHVRHRIIGTATT
jgi:SAM-dependent methyltransferase